MASYIPHIPANLYVPYIAIILSNTINSINGAPLGYSFGTVVQINYNTVKTSINESVLFKLSDAIILTLAGNQFYIIDENLLLFTEGQV